MESSTSLCHRGRSTVDPITPQRPRLTGSDSTPSSTSSRESEASFDNIFDKIYKPKERDLSPVTPPDETDYRNLGRSHSAVAEGRKKKKTTPESVPSLIKGSPSPPIRTSPIKFEIKGLQPPRKKTKTTTASKKPSDLDHPVPGDYFDSQTTVDLESVFDGSDQHDEVDSAQRHWETVTQEKRIPKLVTNPPEEFPKTNPSGFWVPEFLPYRSKNKNTTKSCKDTDRNHDTKPKKDINLDILNYIQETLTTKKKPGWIYVFKHKSHVKIGQSFRPYKRELEWQKCNVEILLVSDEDQDAFDNHHIVETILHKELHNKRKQFFCKTCKWSHKEWFEEGPDAAIKAVKKWRDWMRVQKPFEAGKLTPYWQWRARNLQYCISDVDWEAWTQPGEINRWRFILETHFSSQRKDAWFRVVALAIVTMLGLLYGSTTAALAFVSLCVL